MRSACTKCLGIFLFALRAVMGVSGNEIRRCISSWISFLILDKFSVCVSISLVSWGSHGVYVVMNGGVLSFLLSLSTSDLGVI